MRLRGLKSIWCTHSANSIDAFIPELWAQESLMILEANMVAANLVHRDFSNEIANFGDIVNTRQPAEFVMKRKVDADSVTIQNADATNVPVPLDQHPHTSFMIKDGEESKSFVELRDEYLEPALLSIAQGIDEIVLGQLYQFMANSAGKLGTDPTKATVIGVREFMNANKVPSQGRNLVIPPSMEGALLNVADFINAEKVGDDGTALREGSLGRKFGLNTFMCQNCPDVAVGSTVTVTTLVNNIAGYAKGTTVLAVDGGTTILAGEWCKIAGDDTPHRIVARDADPATQITLEAPGLRYAVLNNAIVTVYAAGDVDFGAGYAAGYAKEIVTTLFTVAPRTGQLVTFGASAATRYAQLTAPTTVASLLDRPLAASIADADVMGIGPAGAYGFAFHRNALALVMRPLAAPASGTGALSFTASYNGLSLRVTITYDGEKQGHLVTVDVLCGVKVLNTSLGGVIFG